MGQAFAKESPKRSVAKAKEHRTEEEALDVIRDALRAKGNVATFVPTKNALKKDNLVYAGDFVEGDGSLAQTRPLLSLEYKRREHFAVVKDGQTGQTLMMLVREMTDYPFYGDGGRRMRLGVGGFTEARLYCNGRPVAVTEKEMINVAPAPQANPEEKAKTGASMVELQKQNEGNAVSFNMRRKDGSVGKQVALYTRVKGSNSILKMSTADVADPLVMCVMAWFSTFDKVGIVS